MPAPHRPIGATGARARARLAIATPATTITFPGPLPISTSAARPSNFFSPEAGDSRVRSGLAACQAKSPPVCRTEANTPTTSVAPRGTISIVAATSRPPAQPSRTSRRHAARRHPQRPAKQASKRATPAGAVPTMTATNTKNPKAADRIATEGDLGSAAAPLGMRSGVGSLVGSSSDGFNGLAFLLFGQKQIFVGPPHSQPASAAFRMGDGTGSAREARHGGCARGSLVPAEPAS